MIVEMRTYTTNPGKTRDWLEYYGLWEKVVVRQWDLALVLTRGLHIMMLLCVILTIASGYRYCAYNLEVFRETPPEK